MKRLFALLLALVLVLGAVSALADQKPQPINKVPYDELPEPLDGQHHYLMLCLDQWHGLNDKGQLKKLGNTDGMVLVTIDSRTHRIMLTSFIRDALVERPDGKIGRINYIVKNYGAEAFCKTLSEHIGVKIDKYIMFDFGQIQKIVDFLGGVDITVNEEEAAYLRRYAISPTSTKPSMAGAGTYRFGGHASVIYMRIRKAGGGGDFMRTQRVRTVLSTLADQCREISYEDAKRLVENVMSNTTMTNMNLDSMMEAMTYAYDLRGATIEELRIPVDGAVHPLRYAGMAAQEVDWEACRAAMADYLRNSFLVVDEDE